MQLTNIALATIFITLFTIAPVTSARSARAIALEREREAIKAAERDEETLKSRGRPSAKPKTSPAPLSTRPSASKDKPATKVAPKPSQPVPTVPSFPKVSIPPPSSTRSTLPPTFTSKTQTRTGPVSGPTVTPFPSSSSSASVASSAPLQPPSTASAQLPPSSSTSTPSMSSKGQRPPPHPKPTSETTKITYPHGQGNVSGGPQFKITKTDGCTEDFRKIIPHADLDHFECPPAYQVDVRFAIDIDKSQEKEMEAIKAALDQDMNVLTYKYYGSGLLKTNTYEEQVNAAGSRHRTGTIYKHREGQDTLNKVKDFLKKLDLLVITRGMKLLTLELALHGLYGDDPLIALKKGTISSSSSSSTSSSSSSSSPSTGTSQPKTPESRKPPAHPSTTRQTPSPQSGGSIKSLTKLFERQPSASSQKSTPPLTRTRKTSIGERAQGLTPPSSDYEEQAF